MEDAGIRVSPSPAQLGKTLVEGAEGLIGAPLCGAV